MQSDDQAAVSHNLSTGKKAVDCFMKGDLDGMLACYADGATCGYGDPSLGNFPRDAKRFWNDVMELRKASLKNELMKLTVHDIAASPTGCFLRADIEDTLITGDTHNVRYICHFKMNGEGKIADAVVCGVDRELELFVKKALAIMVYGRPA